MKSLRSLLEPRLKILDQLGQRQWLPVTLIALVAFAGSALVGAVVGIPEPRIHDEFSYLLAADTFAHGRVTNPTHPMWRHFETFHVIHQPTYMSKYPPGQGLMLAAGLVICGHPILGVWMSFAFMCAAISWMLYRWVAPKWALFGSVVALLHPVTGITGYWAQSYWGGAVAAAGGALVLGGMRHITRARPRDSVIIGIGFTILANSRPYEGLIFSVPMILFLLFRITRGGVSWSSAGRIVTPIVIVLVLAGIAMMSYNLDITGNMLRTPYQIHEANYAMAPPLIFQSRFPEPEYRHAAMRDFYASYALPLYIEQQSISGFIGNKMSALLYLAFGTLHVFAIPVLAVITVLISWGLQHGWSCALLLLYLCFIAGLSLETFTWIHYAAPITALNYLVVVNAARLWGRSNRKIGRLVGWIVPLLAVAVSVNSAYALRKENLSPHWYIQRAQLLRKLKEEKGRHLVLVSYGPYHTTHNEWVYNEADIDQAKVVWARDMDAGQNCALLAYFRDRQIWSLEIDSDQSPPKLQHYPRNLCSERELHSGKPPDPKVDHSLTPHDQA